DEDDLHAPTVVPEEMDDLSKRCHGEGADVRAVRKAEIDRNHLAAEIGELVGPAVVARQAKVTAPRYSGHVGRLERERRRFWPPGRHHRGRTRGDGAGCCQRDQRAKEGAALHGYAALAQAAAKVLSSAALMSEMAQKVMPDRLQPTALYPFFDATCCPPRLPPGQTNRLMTCCRERYTSAATGRLSMLSRRPPASSNPAALRSGTGGEKSSLLLSQGFTEC